MNVKLTLLATACVLALSACGEKSPPPAAEPAAEPAAAAEPAPAPEPAPATEAPAEPAATAPGADAKPAATVANCATEIESNDAMQYNVGSIAVPASCSEFKITLKHTGKLPVTAMGHNVVIAKAADMQGVAADGIAAGAAAAYVKADDARVIAHTSLVGGGESTSVSFAVSKIKDGGPYEFFCSFPGHSALMKGTIAVQ
ncbi:azurin [Aerolutibacter ruishenii]|uniref:Azurin n=1 Tax=Aerolutibacter ruishenii TaxID=686800 RepID=A0A562LWK7_9GAMM|nr:azurin [Lysobacter ruishenii]